MDLVFKKACTIDNENECAYLFLGLDNDLVATILANTNCPKDKLPIGKSDNEDRHEMTYCVSIDRETLKTNAEVYKYLDILCDDILKVANSFSSLEDFCENCLLGGMPSEIHYLVKDKFNITDEDLEWDTAHFFIQLGNLLYAPSFRWTSIEEDIANGEMAFTINNKGEMQDINSVEEYNKLMENNANVED